MKGSIIASQIDNEYRREQFYKNRKRQKCKEKDCYKCKFNEICTEIEVKQKTGEKKYGI